MPRKLNRPSLLVSAAAGLALTLSGLAPVSAAPDGSPDQAPDGLTQTALPEIGVLSADEWSEASSDTGLWIVRAEAPSVAAMGSIADEAGLTEADLSAYREDLVQEQDGLQSQVEATLGRSVQVPYTYVDAFSGFAVEVTKAEAERLRDLDGVAEVYPDEVRELETDVSHEVINSDAVWGGDTAAGVQTRGEGVVVGMIDSGVNPFHPSFAEVDMDGYQHVNPRGSGTYLGVCAEGAANYDPICNDKLIGAWNFHPSAASARDTDSHGSHVGSTIAGSKHEATIYDIDRVVQGVAPRANVVSYLVCSPTCPGTSSIAAVNQAIQDGVDVLNYSISGSDSPWTDPVDLAFLDAYAAGVTVVASAGNSGPGPRTVAKSGPWNSSVAATTHHRVFANSLGVVSPTPVPEPLQDFPGFPGGGPQLGTDITAPVVDAADLGNQNGCAAFPAGSLTGSIALIERGGCTFPIKVANAAAAGAVAVLLGNNAGGPPVAPGGLEDSTIPTVQTDQASYRLLRDFLAAQDGEVQVTLRAGVQLYLNEDWTDIVAAFSSRGPSQFDMLVPTFGAPGVNILAAAAARGDDADQYAVLQGTSMASPHGAGAAALLRAMHPEWSPSQIRSALATSAVVEGIRREDGTTQARPFDIGSGRIDLERAGRAGLVLDETTANFRAANPAQGGAPRTLNLPAMVDWNCAGVCTWERTVTSVADTTATYTAEVAGGQGLAVSVSPQTFTIAPGATQTLTFRADATATPIGDWVDARVTLATSGTHAGGAQITDPAFPVVVRSQPGQPSVVVDPEELASTQPVGSTREHALTIGNEGAATLEWEFTDTYDGAVVDQPRGGTSGIVSDYFIPLAGGAYSADDFTLSSDTELSRIAVPGFWNNGSLASARDLNWQIYADAGGRPAGQPEDDVEPVWEHTAAPTAAGVDITDNSMNLDVVAATQETVSLAAGTYWLVAYPSISTTGAARWNWTQGAGGSGAGAMLSDPNGLFGLDAQWRALQGLVGWDTLAFTLSARYECGADWLSVDPASGSTAMGGTSEVTVTTDATGLEIGSTHSATLCLSTNDPAQPIVLVPVTMTVTDAPIEVERWEGTDRYRTAAAVASTYEPGVDTVFVATGLDYPDALAGAALAGSLDSPVLLTRPQGVPGATAAQVARLQPDRVVVLGGPEAVPDTILTELRGLTDAPVDRLSGLDRYRTAAAVSTEYGQVDRVFVATGADYPDALAAAARAGAVDAPVLLTRKDSIPDATAEALTALSPQRITVLGGEAAVEDDVVQELRQWAPARRLGGNNRYITAARVMAEYASADTVFLASGEDWPDALAGSARAGSDARPLLLTRHGELPPVTISALERLHPERVIVLGGETAVSGDVVEELRALR